MKGKLGFLMLCVLTLSSCRNDVEDLYDPNAEILKKVSEYSKAFVNQFGNIDPNHTWGFGFHLGSRGNNANGNQWWENMEVPVPVSKSDSANVYAYFANSKNYKESLCINWSDFFVQQVHKGTTAYDVVNGNSVSTAVGSDCMNQLMVGSSKESLETVNNFNQGYCNGQNVYVAQNEYYKDGITFMTNSSTLAFAYSNSLDGGAFYYDYIVQEIDGNYYVAFDFKSDNPAAAVEADGIYTDWIVKISPAVYKDKEYKTSIYRIIAEDLGAVGDFDFNDVVFDVAIGVYDGSAQITVHAAGGTLPLYINGVEVHELFGVSTETMVNTGNVSREPVIFKLNGIWDLDAIKITVDGAEVGAYELKANCGEAPQKICVPVTYQWTKEQVSIETKYPKFKNWVGSQEINWIE